MPSNFVIFAYYFFIFCFVAFYKHHKFSFLKCILNYNYLKRKIQMYKKFLRKIFIILSATILLVNIVNCMPKKLRINFLDVRSR